MDIQTNPSGAAGSFSRAQAAPSSWLARNRALALRLSILVAALLLLTIIGALWASRQASKATSAFNEAMDVYDAPIQQPGQPPIPNVKSYPSAAARAKDARPLFEAAAGRYGLFQAGRNARYFAGLTAEDMGDTAAAEANLRKVADGSNAGLAALGKMALAGLYASTGRQSQATGLYQSLIDHPSATVSANAARLALAAVEQTTNPQGARALYAKVKDTDKTTAAGQIAAQRLTGK